MQNAENYRKYDNWLVFVKSYFFQGIKKYLGCFILKNWLYCHTLYILGVKKEIVQAPKFAIIYQANFSFIPIFNNKKVAELSSYKKNTLYI